MYLISLTLPPFAWLGRGATVDVCLPSVPKHLGGYKEHVGLPVCATKAQDEALGRTMPGCAGFAG